MAIISDSLMLEFLHMGDKYIRTPKYTRNAKLTAYIWGKGA